jgi:hypothetical protein
MASARLPELAALDRMFGIEGAEGRSEPREIRDNEVITGDVVAEFVDKSGREKYLVETEAHNFVAIPKEASADLAVGDSIEATRSGSSYSIAIENDYGM